MPDRNDHGQYTGRIPPEAALEAFEAREDHGRPLTAADVMEALDCSRRTAHNKLNELVETGELRTRKVGARSRVWWVPIERPAGADGALGSRERRTTRAVRQVVEEVELPGDGETLERRRAALLAAYEYLIENPSARKSEFLENVYPEHSAGFESREGWWNAIQPALKELPGVDPPNERGHIWTFLGGHRFRPTLG